VLRRNRAAQITREPTAGAIARPLVQRVADWFTTQDPHVAYHGARAGITVALVAVATGIYVATGWNGAIVVGVASGLVLADAVIRIKGGTAGPVLILQVVDSTVIGVAIVLAGLPDVIMTGPYGYVIIGAVLLLPWQRAFIVGGYVAAWVAVILVLDDAAVNPVVPGDVVWIASASAAVVYLAATFYLSMVAAAAMRERGRLSESLRSSRARLHAIVESSGLVVFTLDTSGRITFTESEGLAAFGGPLRSVVGDSIYTTVPDAAELHVAVQEVLVGGEIVSRDIRFGDRAFRVRLVPNFDSAGNVIGLIGTANDETERVAASDALSRKVEMEQLISRLSTHLIGLQPDEIESGVDLALESTAKFVHADRAFVSLVDDDGALTVRHAYSGPGLPDLPAGFCQTPDELPWLFSRLMSGRILAVSRLDMIPAEAWRLRELWNDLGVSSVAIVPIFVFRRFAGAAVITSAREDAFADDDLVLLRFIAEMLVAVMHRKHSHTQLEELVRSKDQFIASVSHELRTPLTTVVGLADELHVRRGDFDGAERDELHRLLAEQAGEVSDIVEDLLVVARADIGKVSIQPASVALRHEIEGVVRGFAGAAGVVTVSGPGDVEGWADHTRVRQILRNLVSNSLRYGGDRVEVRIVEGAGTVSIDVADNGEMLPVEEAEVLFEPYRHSAQVEGRPSSIGLGLTVGRELARLMGGDLTFITADGWNIFRLTVPSAVDVSAEGFASAPGSESVGSGAVQLPEVSVEAAGAGQRAPLDAAPS